MKLVYITANAPYSKGEAFVIQESLEVRNYCKLFLLIPVRPLCNPLYEDAKEIAKNALNIPLFNATILVYFLKFLFLSPVSFFKILFVVFRESRNLRILLKNLLVFPKGVYIGKVLERKKIDHIHSHWASTPTTLAMISSIISGIPFSFTAHRWDIDEDNMLKEKVKRASFVRAISKEGKEEIIKITGLYSMVQKVHVIHMGVRIPKHKTFINNKNKKDFYIFACPAGLVRKKGHFYLVEACALLKERGLNFKCLIIGDGEERENISSLVREKGLEEFVSLEGYYPHSKLMALFENKEVDLVVLPSINTEDGEREGIPVVLMEAMSFGIPVISTETGGIPELLNNEAGIMVPEKDPFALAEAIYEVLVDEKVRQCIAERGFQRVYQEFNIEKSALKLIELFNKI